MDNANKCAASSDKIKIEVLVCDKIVLVQTISDRILPH
jgi:hypothetical protein